MWLEAGLSYKVTVQLLWVSVGIVWMWQVAILLHKVLDTTWTRVIKSKVHECGKLKKTELAGHKAGILECLWMFFFSFPILSCIDRTQATRTRKNIRMCIACWQPQGKVAVIDVREGDCERRPVDSVDLIGFSVHLTGWILIAAMISCKWS